MNNILSDLLNIQKISYELYKKDWENTHISQEEQLKTIRDYYDYVLECESEGFRPDSFDDWLFDVGYGGSLYVCFDEFLECEYTDSEYMKYLFGNNEFLQLLYENDMENEMKEGLE